MHVAIAQHFGQPIENHPDPRAGAQLAVGREPAVVISEAVIRAQPSSSRAWPSAARADNKLS